MDLNPFPKEIRPEPPGERPQTLVKAGGGCAVKAFAAGDACPRCGKGQLDYDGTLNLYCPACGVKFNGGGAFT